jgi:flagellar biosynthesis protein FlhF
MGQKVPEDWERPDAAQLVARSMRAPVKSAFDPKAADLGFFFAQSTSLAPGQFHA